MGELRRMQAPQCARWSFSAATVHIDTSLKCIGGILLCTAVRQNTHCAQTSPTDQPERRSPYALFLEATDRLSARTIAVVCRIDKATAV